MLFQKSTPEEMKIMEKASFFHYLRGMFRDSGETNTSEPALFGCAFRVHACLFVKSMRSFDKKYVMFRQKVCDLLEKVKRLFPVILAKSVPIGRIFVFMNRTVFFKTPGIRQKERKILFLLAIRFP